MFMLAAPCAAATGEKKPPVVWRFFRDSSVRLRVQLECSPRTANGFGQ
jgi:hypothetical protein